MRPPRDVLNAIGYLSERILCISDCFGTCALAWCEFHDQVEIRHPLADCENVIHPDGIEARALSEFVIDELSRYCAMAEYNEVLPVHVSLLAGAP